MNHPGTYVSALSDMLTRLKKKWREKEKYWEHA